MNFTPVRKQFGNRTANVPSMRLAGGGQGLEVRSYRLYSFHIKHLEEEIGEDGSLF